MPKACSDGITTWRSGPEDRSALVSLRYLLSPDLLAVSCMLRDVLRAAGCSRVGHFGSLWQWTSSSTTLASLANFHMRCGELSFRPVGGRGEGPGTGERRHKVQCPARSLHSAHHIPAAHPHQRKNRMGAPLHHYGHHNLNTPTGREGRAGTGGLIFVRSPTASFVPHHPCQAWPFGPLGPEGP